MTKATLWFIYFLNIFITIKQGIKLQIVQTRSTAPADQLPSPQTN